MGIRICLFSIVVSSVFYSCKKDSGEGGTAQIKGKVLAGNYFSPNVVPTEEDAVTNERVYIIYGNGNAVNDDVRTSYDGSFNFRFLRKGIYQVFTYSLNPALPNTSETVFSKTIEITKKDQTIDIGNWIIYKEADDDGSSTIVGKVYAKKYNSTFTSLLSEYYAPDEDVYIIYGDNTSYNERIRSSFDGTFEFKNLRKGLYKIFVYSDDSAKIVNGASSPPPMAVFKDIEITANNKLITTQDIIIFK
jgi:hypothetical protein